MDQIYHYPVLVGAHMSIAGSMHTAVERAMSIGCSTMQVFVKNNNQWHGKQLSDNDVGTYRELLAKSNIHPVMAHDTYLINLCALNQNTLHKSRKTLKDEFCRCERLGIDYLNFHPGSHIGQGEKEGIKLIAESLNLIHEQTIGFKVKSVLETTAGQGTAIGYRFEQLHAIIDLIDDKDRMAVCVDTCHVFAAGYDISNEAGWEKTFNEFDDILGLERLVAFHVNDSKRDLGSYVDRHEHIDKGRIGILGFRLLMNDPRFERIPKILETPKGEDMREDIENMGILRDLLSCGNDVLNPSNQ
jgi:deoxyribonuclease IV